MGLYYQVGVLTRHILDDGRGFARSKVFKHGHEEATGRTSSIGQHNLCVSTLLLPCWLLHVTAEPRAAAPLASMWTKDNTCAACQCLNDKCALCHGASCCLPVARTAVLSYFGNLDCLACSSRTCLDADVTETSTLEVPTDILGPVQQGMSWNHKRDMMAA